MGTATATTEEKKTAHAQTCIVTARVPVEIREQVNAKLKEMGSTPTELVNAAYRYVLERGELPQTGTRWEDVAERRQRLSKEEKLEMLERLERMTPKAPASWEGKSYEELRDEAMRERFPEYCGQKED